MSLVTVDQKKNINTVAALYNKNIPKIVAKIKKLTV